MSAAGAGVPLQIGLPPAQFAAAFPFHLATDESLTLLQVGATLGRLCPDVRPDVRLDAVFRSVRPEGAITVDWVRAHKERFFLIEHRGSGLQLRGQFIDLPTEKRLLFLGSPWFTDAAEIAARGLGFDDFAIHDPVVDLLQVFQSSKMALADAKKLAAKLSVQREELRGANERLRLRGREARQLALIAARTDNAVVLTDAAGLVLWVNEGFTRLTGYVLDDVRGRKPGAVLQGPGTDPVTVRRIGERLQRGEGFTAEILNYRKDGREYWFAIEVQPIVGESGQVENYMSIGSDITERRAAEARLAMQFEVASTLAESDNRREAFRRVLKLMGQRLGWQIGQMWLPTEGRLRLAESWYADTSRLSAFIGASEGMSFGTGEGLPGRVWATGTSHWVEDVTRDANFLRAEFAARSGLRGALLVPITVHGQTYGVLELFSTRPERADEVLLRTFGTVAVQIGEFIVRTQAQEALRSSEERFRAAFEDAHAGMALGRLDTHFLAVNRTFCEMLGYSEKELLGKTSLEITHPDDLAVTSEAAQDIASGRSERVDIEKRFVRKDGRAVWVIVRARLHRGAGGGPELLVSHFLDITGRKEAEQALQREKNLLEEARQRELQTGYEIQRTLLIGDVPALDPGLDIAAYAVPSRGIDGDFYAFTRFRGDCFELLVGDVMGKGVPAALVGAAVRTAYNHVVTELVAARRGGEALPRPAEIVNALHARLTPRLVELDTFVTLALYRFELATGSLTFVNAGHTAGLLRRRDGQIEPILGHNVPVGAVEDEQYVESTRAIEAGESLLVYSDGITEARNGDGIDFGEPRLGRLFQELCACAAPARIRLQALHKRLLDYVGERAIPDDETAVLIDLRGPFAAGRRTDDDVVGEELIELPWDVAGLEPLRRQVGAAATTLERDAVDRLVLAAFEVVTNVVRHVQQPFADATLSCRLRSEADRVTVEVWFVGLPFAPPAQHAPDFSGDNEGGFGLYIIENAVSRVSYEQPVPGVCCTRLVQMAGVSSAAV